MYKKNPKPNFMKFYFYIQIIDLDKIKSVGDSGGHLGVWDSNVLFF